MNSNVNYLGNDISLITAYRSEDCVRACQNLNTIMGMTTCRGFLFNANLQRVVAENGGNCWLGRAMPPSVGRYW